MKLRYTLAFCFLFLATSANAQSTIPNGSFEEWAGGNPVGWTTTNFAGVIETVSKSTLHTDGAFAVYGIVKDLSGTPIAPSLYAGDFNGTGATGFPFTERPQGLNGMLAADLKTGDAVFMSVTLLKNGQAVAGNSSIITKSSASFVPFSIPLLYVSNETPDTAFITITIANTSTGTPALGSNFTIDGLAFGAGSGSVAGAEEISFNVSERNGIYTFQLPIEEPQNISLDILDINGRFVRHVYSGVHTGGEITWDPAHLASGIYLAKLKTPSGQATRKIGLVR